MKNIYKICDFQGARIHKDFGTSIPAGSSFLLYVWTGNTHRCIFIPSALGLGLWAVVVLLENSFQCTFHGMV
jgi:hypothetical protein